MIGEERLLDGRRWLCSTAASLCIVSCIVSLFTMAFIAINRYLYVCWQAAYATVFTSRCTVLAVVSTWAAGVAIDSPNHLGWSSHWFDTKTQKCMWDRTAAYHYTILFVVVGMLLPFVVTTVSYWRIFAHIQLSKRRVLSIQSQARPGATIGLLGTTRCVRQPGLQSSSWSSTFRDVARGCGQSHPQSPLRKI